MTLGQYLREYLASVFTIAGAELIPPGVGEPSTYPAYQVDLNYKTRTGEVTSADGFTVRVIEQSYSVRGWVATGPDTAGTGLLDTAMDDLEEKMMLAADKSALPDLHEGEGYKADFDKHEWGNIWRAPDDVNGTGSITIDGILTYYYVVE